MDAGWITWGLIPDRSKDFLSVKKFRRALVPQIASYAINNYVWLPRTKTAGE
jgi:hypothetical protein